MLKYKDFGVDIDSGNSFIKKISPLVKETFSPLVLGGLGGFSGAFSLPSGYENPILCACTDGVGSKLNLAIEYNRLEKIGIDLVAMNVNDLICSFATPLVFLDYYAMNKLVVEDSVKIIKGITEGCKRAKCSLIGGESAEMPSLYKKGDFDLAGFSIGIAERCDLERLNTIQEGDVIIALPSSGFHSNGYSLLRGIIESKKIDLDSKLVDFILKPTRIYVEEFLELKDDIKAISHITGGGLAENLVRVLPKDKSLEARIQKNSIKVDEKMKLFTQYVDESEAFRVFNMGVGLVLIAHASKASLILDKTDGYIIGEIKSCTGEQSKVTLQD